MTPFGSQNFSPSHYRTVLNSHRVFICPQKSAKPVTIFHRGM